MIESRSSPSSVAVSVVFAEARSRRCNKKYCERANFDGECRHHTKPPVFHETAKYWSCCPHKKAYDWESFMEIKGCAYGKHSDVKPQNNAALGGSHVRGQTNKPDPNLKKIEDFNSGRSAVKPLEALKHALIGVGCSAADYDKALQVLGEKFKGGEHRAGTVRPVPPAVPDTTLERRRNFDVMRPRPRRAARQRTCAILTGWVRRRREGDHGRDCHGVRLRAPQPHRHDAARRRRGGVGAAQVRAAAGVRAVESSRGRVFLERYLGTPESASVPGHSPDSTGARH